MQDKLLNIFSTEHLIRLRPETEIPHIKRLYNRLQSDYDEFVENYAKWVVSKNRIKYLSNKLAGQLEDLSYTKYPEWAKKINKRIDLEAYEINLLSGKINNRIKALNDLFIELDKSVNQASIIPIYREIKSFCQQVNDLQSRINDTEKESEAYLKRLKEAREKLDDRLIKNFLSLQKMRPEKLKKYYNLNISEEYDKLCKSIPNNGNQKIEAPVRIYKVIKS